MNNKIDKGSSSYLRIRVSLVQRCLCISPSPSLLDLFTVQTGCWATLGHNHNLKCHLELLVDL